jgi:hypothetical protein
MLTSNSVRTAIANYVRQGMQHTRVAQHRYLLLWSHKRGPFTRLGTQPLNQASRTIDRRSGVSREQFMINLGPSGWATLGPSPRRYPLSVLSLRLSRSGGRMVVRLITVPHLSDSQPNNNKKRTAVHWRVFCENSQARGCKSWSCYGFPRFLNDLRTDAAAVPM